MKKIFYENLFLFSLVIIAVFINLSKKADDLSTLKNDNHSKVNLEDVSIYKLEEGENKEAIYRQNGISQKVIYKNQEIANLIFSPDKRKIGFFYMNDYPRAGRDISLAIMDISNKNTKEIYRNTHKTSYWEWLNNNEIAVYFGCGTECMAVYLINADTGEQKTPLVYGVGYEWAPNKDLVLAYNYSAGYGITVGDKNNNELLILRREPPDFYNDLVDKTLALWSPDSSKLALIIKKEDADEMEILAFRTADFKQIFQSDIEFAEDAEFVWADNNKIIYNNVDFLIN